MIEKVVKHIRRTVNCANNHHHHIQLINSSCKADNEANKMLLEKPKVENCCEIVSPRFCWSHDGTWTCSHCMMIIEYLCQ